MTLHAALHSVAAVLMASALLMHPGVRDRACRGDLVAGAVMLAAMVDAMWLRLTPVAYAMAALTLAGMTMAGGRSLRARREGSAPPGMCRTSHAPLGFVATAACLPSMQGLAVSAVGGHAHHGLGSGAFTAFVVAICAGYAVLSVVAAHGARQRGDAAQYALMGSGSLLMALGAL